MYRRRTYPTKNCVARRPLAFSCGCATSRLTVTARREEDRLRFALFSPVGLSAAHPPFSSPIQIGLWIRNADETIAQHYAHYRARSPTRRHGTINLYGLRPTGPLWDRYTLLETYILWVRAVVNFDPDIRRVRWVGTYDSLEWKDTTMTSCRGRTVLFWAVTFWNDRIRYCTNKTKCTKFRTRRKLILCDLCHNNIVIHNIILYFIIIIIIIVF